MNITRRLDKNMGAATNLQGVGDGEVRSNSCFEMKYVDSGNSSSWKGHLLAFSFCISQEF